MGCSYIDVRAFNTCNLRWWSLFDCGASVRTVLIHAIERRCKYELYGQIVRTFNTYNGETPTPNRGGCGYDGETSCGFPCTPSRRGLLQGISKAPRGNLLRFPPSPSTPGNHKKKCRHFIVAHPYCLYGYFRLLPLTLVGEHKSRFCCSYCLLCGDNKNQACLTDSTQTHALF